ncbi:MAG: DEAD/DEAH box helicase family protein [Candidatus Obscuribacterales bacterium]|nr:DEAD/DEAH box helicase family protein [Candidatus Obscuribacterales bacterium]
MRESTALDDEISPLKGLAFRHPLRRYQQEIIELTRLKLEKGERAIHIVAPPGAGKTIIGLQLATQLEHNTLIISPTTTIQAQWGEKLNLFLPAGQEESSTEQLLGTHEDKPLKPITLLTYQVLSTPGREQEYLEKLAHKSWVDELLSTGLSQGDAEIRILELMQNNKKAYEKEISRHVTRLRRKLSDLLDLKEVLHPNAINLIQALRRQKFRTVIFDECHHLTDYWAAIMTHVLKQLDNPIIIGLTGTPPEGKSQNQENRYLSLVGEIDYQVPTPALVREGGLAPFQDLVYFTVPTITEEKFLDEQHEAFHSLLQELAEGENSLLTKWVDERVENICKDNGWKGFVSRNSDLACAFIRYMYKYRMPLPLDLEFSENFMQFPFIEDWMCLLEDFTLNYLKVSASTDNHELYERIRQAIAKLGYGLTEKGLRKQASPVDRVLAFSKSKAAAVADILEVEYRNLDERLRAVVVTDFERMSATAVKQAKGVLNEESGGAISVLREVLKTNVSQYLNPCLVTGSLILVDNRIASQFISALQEMLEAENLSFKLALIDHPDEAFCEVSASSTEWEARLYVRLATKVLERGITKLLVGTRGIFGEGWDCQALNTLIDLTTTTTPVSVKQLRGRSIRINTNDPLGAHKVANNWDVVCIAPYLEKGLNDYQRFARKHAGYFGICDDGQIECGVGHVHPSFSELTPAEVFANQEEFNQEMKLRALAREGIYSLWKVGQPYSNKTVGCIEIGRLRKIALTPPQIRRDLSYEDHAKLLRANLNGVWLEYGGISAAVSSLTCFLLAHFAWPLIPALIPFLGGAVLAVRRHKLLYNKIKEETCRPNTQESSLLDMARTVLSSLQQTKLLPKYLTKEAINISIRSDGTYRVFLDEVDEQQSQYFVKCMKELLEPIRKQPFLIPKYEYDFPSPRNRKKMAVKGKEGSARLVEQELKPENRQVTNLSTHEDFESEERFFKAYLKGNAEPRIAAYYPVPSLLARSEKGRDAFQAAWNKYVSPGFIVATEEKPELLNRYFGLGASLAQRLLWE